MTQEIMDYVSSNVFGVWFLIGAALVFWMQAGFTMVEAGFTRAKNTGNILMKNLMDFSIGCLMFMLIGFTLLLGDDIAGLIGTPSFGMFTDYANFDFSNFVFNLVFCATTATIVSGAMAERTKFASYCLYTVVISAFIYPIEAHWIWGGGWLSELGFHDFAGSCAIHMVGGICAFVGAALLGARIGKFRKDGSPRAIPGCNIAMGCLGVFILWLGWYGFNGAACTTVDQLASVFLTTSVAPSTATVVCMLLTWKKYGKPDVSMCCNAALAGLVAITAPCDVTDAFGAFIIGGVAGVLVVYGVAFLDYKLKVDDPVGAVAVHGICGAWGALAVGLFATSTAPEFAIADSAGNEMLGLFYGGGFKLLGIQLLGVVSVAAWSAVTICIFFKLVKNTVGLRVERVVEIEGLDVHEHGLLSAYSGFVIHDVSAGLYADGAASAALGEEDYSRATKQQIEKSVPVIESRMPSSAATGIYNVSVVFRNSRYEALKTALGKIGVAGMTVTQVMGCGEQKGRTEQYRGVKMEVGVLPKVKLEVVVSSVPLDKVINTIRETLYSGHIGDGKIFVYDVARVVKVRTGEENVEALHETAADKA